jgi:hypothetical protein
VVGPTAPRVRRCPVSSRELKTTPDLIRPIPLNQASLSLEHSTYSLCCDNYLRNLRTRMPWSDALWPEFGAR